MLLGDSSEWLFFRGSLGSTVRVTLLVNAAVSDLAIGDRVRCKHRLDLAVTLSAKSGGVTLVPLNYNRAMLQMAADTANEQHEAVAIWESVLQPGLAGHSRRAVYLPARCRWPRGLRH